MIHHKITQEWCHSKWPHKASRSQCESYFAVSGERASSKHQSEFSSTLELWVVTSTITTTKSWTVMDLFRGITAWVSCSCLNCTPLQFEKCFYFLVEHVQNSNVMSFDSPSLLLSSALPFSVSLSLSLSHSLALLSLSLSPSLAPPSDALPWWKERATCGSPLWCSKPDISSLNRSRQKFTGPPKFVPLTCWPYLHLASNC